MSILQNRPICYFKSCINLEFFILSHRNNGVVNTLEKYFGEICYPSPHEAGGGTRCMAPQVKSRRAFLVRCAKAAGRRIFIFADPGSIKWTVPTDATSGGIEMYRGNVSRSMDRDCKRRGKWSGNADQPKESRCWVLYLKSILRDLPVDFKKTDSR